MNKFPAFLVISVFLLLSAVLKETEGMSAVFAPGRERKVCLTIAISSYSIFKGVFGLTVENSESDAFIIRISNFVLLRLINNQEITRIRKQTGFSIQSLTEVRSDFPVSEESGKNFVVRAKFC